MNNKQEQEENNVWEEAETEMGTGWSYRGKFYQLHSCLKVT